MQNMERDPEDAENRSISLQTASIIEEEMCKDEQLEEETPTVNRMLLNNFHDSHNARDFAI